MKNHNISKKVLSIALSVGVSSVPLSSVHAMLNGGGNKKEELKTTTQSSSSSSSSTSSSSSSSTDSSSSSSTSTSSSSSSSSSSTNEYFKNIKLSPDWRLGDEKYATEEAQMLNIVNQKWGEFWDAAMDAARIAAIDDSRYAAQDTVWNAARYADCNFRDAAWERGSAAYKAIVYAANNGEKITTKDGTKISIGSIEYLNHLMKVLDKQTEILKSCTD